MPQSTTTLNQNFDDFVIEHIQPIAKDVEASGQFSKTLWHHFGKIGALGMTVPTEEGGSARSYLDHVRFMEAICQISPSIGLSYAAHSNLCVNQIARYGTRDQKKAFFPPLLSGTHIGGLAITEPDTGSDATGIQLHAKITPNGLVLNGEKMWITNAPVADTLVVYATTNPQLKSKGITACIVTKEDGFIPGPPLKKLGMHGSPTSGITFKNCLIPIDQILGELNQGVSVMMSGLDYERVILAGGPLGIMKACINHALTYVRQRKQFGKPIGEFQMIQEKIANMYSNYQSARAWVYQSAQACDQGTITRHQAASALMQASSLATQVTLEAIQCLGANGYSQNYPVAQLLADAKLFEIGGGTNEIRRLLIGRSLIEGGIQV